MTEKDQQIQPSRWSFIGGPEGGSVAALAIHRDKQYLALAATGIGILASSGDLDVVGKKWERLINSPGNVVTLEISPDYSQDHFLVTGNHLGIYYSIDEGKFWLSGNLPEKTCAIATLAISPNFSQDGIIFAGTQEKGVIYSADRGQNWEARSAEALTSSVFALALSPAFADDATVFAGAEEGLFASRDCGLTWKKYELPEGTGTILSIAFSSNYAKDGTLFVGTEEGGLFVSKNRGESWQVINTPGLVVNGIHVSKKFTEDRGLILVTDKGVFQSTDSGESWQELSNNENGVCLARVGELTLVGLVGNGLLRRQGSGEMKPVEGFFARTLSSFKISPIFEGDGVAFCCGIGEGLWRTLDGGVSWENLSAKLPERYVTDIVFSPKFKENKTAFVATDFGIYVTHDGGDTWQVCQQGWFNHLAISLTGQTLLAGSAGNGVYCSADGGATWSPLEGPWKSNGFIKDVALASDDHYFVAFLNIGTSHNEFSFGNPGHWNRFISRDASDDYVSIYIPPTFSKDMIWYGITGAKVWRFGVREDLKATGVPIRGNTVDRFEPQVLAITCVPIKEGRIVLASTDAVVYRSAEGLIWIPTFTIQTEPMVCLVPSSSKRAMKRIYALGLGGRIWKALIQ